MTVRTCSWFTLDGSVHCQAIATQRIVTNVALLGLDDWLFCDQHAKMIMQELAQSPFTVSALAHRVDDAQLPLLEAA